MHRLLTTLIGIVFIMTAASAQTRFLEAVPDLPLPPAFAETGDATVVFDKAEGRVVRSSAHAPSGAPSGRSFYRETLPELGWRRISGDGADDVYERGDERLTLSFHSRTSGRRIDFSLTPRS